MVIQSPSDPFQVRTSVHRTWKYQHPTSIVFGDGAFSLLPERCHGDRILAVMSAGSARRGLAGQVRTALGPRLAGLVATASTNPDVDELVAMAESVDSADITGIVAVGGGSAIDTGKFLSAALTPGTDAHAMGQELRAGRSPALRKSIPVLAIPTTAGTGSEVTPFATVWDRRDKAKMSLAAPNLVPHTAILDPLLTVSVPLEATISTGLDALSQGLESLWNRNWNAMSAAYATRAIVLSMRYLPMLAEDLHHMPARRAMLEASLLSGLAISHTRTALAHSMSYPITANLGLPHGLACGFTLPSLFAFNWPEDQGGLGGLLLTVGDKNPDSFISSLDEVLAACEVASYLEKYGVNVVSTVPLGSEMLTPGRSDNNCREASAEDVVDILRDAFTRLWGR